MGPHVASTDLYYDPYDFDIDADPYPIWRRMRDEAPLYYNERHDFYALSRFDDVERCSVDWPRYISGKGSVLEMIKSGIEMPPGTILFEDPPARRSAGVRGWNASRSSPREGTASGRSRVTPPIVESAVPRMLPALTPENRPFWTGGANGELLILRCLECRRWVHPPTGSCPACAGALRPEAVSGRGSVFTFTVNAYQFHPDVPPSNVIAIVELDEQDDLRIPTNIVSCDEAGLRCGLPVQVLFERHGEVFYPLFEPVRSAESARGEE